MKKTKKIISLLLSVLMICTSVPFVAFANTTTANVDVVAYDMAVSSTDASITWNPYDLESELTPVTTLEAGKAYAISFVVSNMTDFTMFSAEIPYDVNKIAPVTYAIERRKLVETAPSYDNQGIVLEDCKKTTYYSIFADSPALDDIRCLAFPAEGVYSEPRLSIMVGVSDREVGTLTGNTVYGAAAYDPDIDDYVDVTMKGSYLFTISMKALQDIPASELASCFHPNLDDIDGVFVLDADGKNKNKPITWGPQGNPPQPAEKVTYTFADGSTQELDATAEAPANTAAKTEHVANTETHKVTTYSWAADGDKAFKEQPNETTAPCDFKETAPAVAPIHTADGTLTDGKTAVETCAACGFEKGGEVVKATHSYTMTHVDATCVVKAHDHYVCSVCGDAYDDNFTGELADHKWVQTGSSAADCQTPGTIDYECEVCHDTKTETGAYGAHKLTAHEAVAADCVNGGNDAYWTCDVCNKMFADAEGATEITKIPATPAKGHTLTAHEAVAADCVNGGNDAYWTCDVCGKMFSDAAGTTEITEIPATPAKGHTWVNEEAIPANRAEEGREAGRYCTECDAREGYAVIPALGVDITVSGSSLGTATVNGEAVANAVKNVPYAQNYTLVATANAGAKFVGWKVADKLVSTEETYTTAAFADMTYVPVFAEDTADAFTITFVDAYDNVVTTVSSADLPLSELPAAPEFAGVTFDAWSLDLDAVNALTKAEKVVATYKNVEDKIYTVTASEGCTITVNGEAVASPAAAAYNDTVTVTSAGAQGWSVNGSTEAAAYGETYTFYCGSDITVAPIAAVDAVPTVKAVSDNATGYQVKFLATRSVPEGYTLIESGFVYGKGMTADDLKLENVGKVAGNGTVKQAVCQNKAADGQFALTYGVKNMDAAACAVAYVICTGANGTVVYYSDAMIHSY